MLMKKYSLTFAFLYCSILVFGQIQYFHTDVPYDHLKGLKQTNPIHTLRQKTTFPADSSDLLDLKQKGVNPFLDLTSRFYLLNEKGQVIIYHMLDKNDRISNSDTNHYTNDKLALKISSNQITHATTDSTWYSYHPTNYIYEYNTNGLLISEEKIEGNYEGNFLDRELTLYSYQDTLVRKMVKKTIDLDFLKWAFTDNPPK